MCDGCACTGKCKIDAAADAAKPRKNTLDEMIAVLQGIKDGKKFRYRYVDSNFNSMDWREAQASDTFKGNFFSCQYEIVKEPEKIYKIFYTKPGVSEKLWANTSDYERFQELLKRFKMEYPFALCRVQEFIEVIK